MAKTTGLGKGVSALFGASTDEERFFYCEVDRIIPNKQQPRFVFNQQDLQELADSIKENGVIQPLIVSKVSADQYSLIAGERRLRASKMAGLHSVPVVVQNVGGEDAFLELALIENIQRTDLNPLEEAEAYKRLIDRFGYTQEEAAKRVGKNRSTISNALRLLALPDYIREDILTGLLSEGHARTLLRLIDEPALLREIRNQTINKQLSVRQLEQLIRRLKRAEHQKESKSLLQTTPDHEFSPAYLNALTTQITNRLQSRVAISSSGSRGKIEIEFYSVDDLERLVGILTNESS